MTTTNPTATESDATTYAPTIVIGGGKGGVGKSTCTLVLLYTLELAGKLVHLIEADTSNPDVAKAYANKPAGDHAPALRTDAQVATGPHMSTLDLDREDGWLDLLNLRANHPERILILNTRSASNHAIEQFGPLLAAGLKELGAPLVTIWPIDGNRDCLELLSQYRETFTTGRFLILRNAHLSRNFDFYDSSNLRREIEAAGGSSKTLPELSGRVAQAINIHRLSFTAAERSDQLQFGHKIALRAWLQSVSTMLAEVAA